MEPTPRHQCLIYKGAPSKHLPALAEAMREKLRQNYRCLYLNSPPMVAGLRSYLAAAGVEVAQEVAKGRLMLSSDQQHLADGSFDIDRMLRTLDNLLTSSLRDRYKGLWAVGDMTWELGPERDPARLLEYEWRLEKIFRERPELGGICQYHADTLPRDLMRQSLLVHPSIFVNQTLSLVNPHFLHSEARANGADHSAELDAALTRICQSADLGQAYTLTPPAAEGTSRAPAPAPRPSS
jgi:MEDS: MEthanogen/methylotroph, DcmR Sensory domain